MGFQDNSGDIILDVVLTDEGRKRLASATGTFRITKFALGDDEINYELFNVGASTALQDLSILQTPVLEAFTNNTSSMKSRLLYNIGTGQAAMMSIWYLPIMKLNTVLDINKQCSSARFGDGATTFVVTADGNTHENTAGTGVGYAQNGNIVNGIQNGAPNPTAGGVGLDGGHIRIDCGFDTGDTSAIDTSLVETSFTIQMDDRILKLRDTTGANQTFLSLDDDNFALYEAGTSLVSSGTGIVNDSSTPLTTGGYLSYILKFKLGANSSNLQCD